MCRTFLNPKTCGFGKVATLYAVEKASHIERGIDEGKTKFGARMKQEQFKIYQEIFRQRSADFAVDFKRFNLNFATLQSAIKKWSPRKKKEKEQFLESFSVDKWTELSETKKQEHSLYDCKGCHQNYSKAQSLFPVHSPRLKSKTKENPFNVCSELQGKLSKAKLANKTAIKDTAKSLYESINSAFVDISGGISFAEALTKVPETNLKIKETRYEAKKARRQLIKEVKENTEAQWAKTSLLRCLGNRQSFASRQRDRLTMSHESRKEAEERYAANKRVKRKNHTGNIDTMTWDKEGLKKEVESYEDGVPVNWSALARQFNVKNKKGENVRNGGQIVQEYLVNEGFNIHRFKRKCNNTHESQIRRKKLRGLGGEISLPTPETNAELKNTLKLKIQKGEYTLGELIVPQKYKKMVLDKDGKIRTHELLVEGRKIPLNDVREKLLKKHSKYTRQHQDEYYDEMSRLEVVDHLNRIHEFDDTEGLTVMRNKLKRLQRQRHLMVWHDHSTVANHGHLVFMVAAIYDSAFYLTPDEYFDKTGIKIDVQSQVEMPEIHIMGRCKSNDDQQLTYIETRCECLKGLKNHINITDGVPVSDIMRFFKGDGPAVAFESGQQKGGHFFCSTCGMHAIMSDTLDHVYRCKHVSLKDKQKEIVKGKHGKNNSRDKQLKPLRNLNREEIIEELRARGVYPDLSSKPTKCDLQKELTSLLQGIQRVPALLYLNPTSTLESQYLGSYEALACEPMHDISNHINNVLQELRHHITEQQKAVFDDLYEAILGNKETKRATDYRHAIILFAKQFQNTLTQTQQQLLNTLAEMQEILYLPDSQRCPRIILRYHNLSFLHFLMCSLEFGSTPLSLNRRKLYGKYLHNLTSHEPIQLRLISGQSSNAENEERVFNTIKGITKDTSNYRPSQIISNIFLRLQAEQELGSDHHNTINKQRTHISIAAATLEKLPNTIIPSMVLQDSKYSQWWQAHLEKISDFLVPGEGVWWKYDRDFNEIEFFDSDQQQRFREQGPSLHHFRSSSFKEEELYLEECWKECIDKHIPVPAHFLYQENKAGKVYKTTTGYLSDHYNNDNIQEVAPNPCPPFVSEEDDEVNDENVIDLHLDEEHDEALCGSQQQSHSINPTILASMNTTPQDMPSPNMANNDLPEHHFDELPLDQPFTSVNKHNSLQSERESRSDLQLEESVYKCKTKEGKAVEVVLGSTNEVKQFDSARLLLKTKPENKYAIESYKEKLAYIQTSVSARETQLKTLLKNWEKQFYIEHDCRPASIKEIEADKNASLCLKQLKYSKQLLHAWNVSF